MDSVMKYGAVIAMAAVVFVLFLGLRNLLRGGDSHYSNKMMRWRVLLQFIAIVFIMATLYFTDKMG
jgi:hypothetical protein